ncbi:AsnC family protein [Saccharothrix coeruleofusca]|uniref:AsnC family protein n=1 Tax=Saccharothrix coeruleofusca TaxID=33919 RepID=A0A918ALM0_9PSEU|nr:AsnC family protein [Saccharothrix coeruleofusca]MBP2338340.1 DNA-binding Lrp family transcriptional regulator [Saccharothrix coeruleofusca]GGP49009.1 AsnC family protein [Saccharothrix coeruleofusca]
MVAPDPVDARLLAMIAEMGRAAVHEVAARLGMDPREAATRLITLSGSGLPLLVGVECDPNGIRKALANSVAWGSYTGPAQGTASGPYPPPGSVRGTPSGPYPPHPGPQGPPSQPFPAQPQSGPVPVPEPMSTWGPPQSAGWARGDQQPAPRSRTGKIGSTLETEGLEGARFTIQLVEVVDPADFLFTAAGYKLADGERAVVVHTELANIGTVPFNALPDMYLVLMTNTGETVSKAPVSLSSRPPHKIGVQPGETAGGHTVYVLPENVTVTSVRWSSRPETDLNTLVWTVDD